MKKTLVVSCQLLICIFTVVGQPTNPTPQALPYSQNFGTSSFSALPAGWAVWNGLPGNLINRQDTAEITFPTGNASITNLSSPPVPTQGGGAYGYAPNGNGVLYIQTSSNTANGVDQPVLALNTVGVVQVKITYTITMIVSGRVIGTALQYRIGTSGGWTTIPGSVYQHSNLDRPAGQSDAFSDLLLPNGAANQPQVQLRWIFWRGAATTVSTSSGLSLDDINVTGTTGTIVNNPASFTLTNLSDSKISLFWNLPSGSFDSILVFGRNGTPVDYTPHDSGKNYSNASAHWTAAGSYGNSKLLYSGTGTDVLIDELTSNTAHYFKAFTFKDTVYSSGTVQVFDTTMVQGINNLSVIPGDGQAVASWINYAGEQGVWWDEVLVLAKAGSPVDALPSGDGSTYAANSSFASGSELGTGNFVIYKGIGSIDTLTGLVNGTTYHILAMVRHGSSWSGVSKIKRISFISGVIITVPPIPTLIAPTDGAIGISLNPVLSWSASPSAITYRIQIAKDALFSTMINDSAGLTKTTYSLTGLTAGTKYYWRVNATNTAGSSSYSPSNSFTTISQETGGTAITYYQSVYKLYGTALKQALHNLIKGHSSVGYDGLYDAYTVTDTKPGNVVWDMYSDIPGGIPAYIFYHGQKQCGNQSSEGDCYNREHSWCDSWLGGTNPARADLFNVYPTDGRVNNLRSNYPYGNVGSASWTSTNGSKLGSCSYPGYSGKVFEPINAYKGDFARSHLYVSVRYYTEDASWITTPGTNKSDLLPWYANQMYDWHVADVVSEKEVNRNNAVYGIQHNRNPFIDHPEFAAEIWKTDMAPSVVSMTETSTTTTMIDFSRYLDSTQAVNPASFIFDGGIGNPLQIQWGNQYDVSKIVLTTRTLASGTVYSIQIKNQKSINGVAMNDTTISFRTSGATGISVNNEHPKQYSLSQNYPNPFNPATNIEFQIANREFVSLKVFDLLGRERATLIHGALEPGRHSVSFDIQNSTFGIFSSGIYFYRLTAGQYTVTRQMLLLK